MMMTSTQVVELSVNITNNSPSWDYSHPDVVTTQMTETPGFKPVALIACKLLGFTVYLFTNNEFTITKPPVILKFLINF